MDIEELRQTIIETAIKRRIVKDKKEFEEYDEKYLDHLGCRSFTNYVSYLLSKEFKEDGGVFVTLCKPMLKDKEKLKEKFGLEIKGIGDIN